MAHIALKVDVDTDRGTREGVPRLADTLERLGVRATFLFSLGPDHTGRAIRRVFRRGFLRKVSRTSVVSHYGVKTLLYGTLLPGPHIGRRHGALMRGIAERGFEVGIHTYDHTRWQDKVAHANESWTRNELMLAHDQFTSIFGQKARVHGAAGWQINRFLPDLESQFGFSYASDVRGESPFLPVLQGEVARVPQFPTTLPTLDELLCRTDIPARDPLGMLLQSTQGATCNQVYTLHAEIEGGEHLRTFERLLRAWKDQGHEPGGLADQFATTHLDQLPHHKIEWRSIAGRAGFVASQGRCVDATHARAGDTGRRMAVPSRNGTRGHQRDYR